MTPSELPFKQFWQQTVFPAIDEDLTRLLDTTPTRIAQKLQQKAEKKGEGREAV